jgi:hypothetical protein
MKGGLKKNKNSDYSHQYDLQKTLTDKNDIKQELVPFDEGYIFGACKIHYFEGGMIFHMNLKARENCRPHMENSKPIVKLHFCLKGEKNAGLYNPIKVLRMEISLKLTT